MRAAFEAELPHRLRRAERVRLQAYVPPHWFTATASECAELYVAGFFYGVIAVAACYVDALSRYLAGLHAVRPLWDAAGRCKRLARKGALSDTALEAALSILKTDVHFDKEDAVQYQELGRRAEECLARVTALESEVFAYTLDGRERVVPARPEYWCREESKDVQIELRQHLQIKLRQLW